LGSRKKKMETEEVSLTGAIGAYSIHIPVNILAWLSFPKGRFLQFLDSRWLCYPAVVGRVCMEGIGDRGGLDLDQQYFQRFWRLRHSESEV